MSSKRTQLTLNDKLNILKEIDLKVDRKIICEKYSIANCTVSAILRHREALEESCQSWSGKVKRRRINDHPKLDAALLKWIRLQRSLDVTLSGPLLIEKANQFCQQLNIGGESREVSVGWIDRFKNRHGVVFRDVPGESGFENQPVVEDWLRDVWPVQSNGYKDEDIFNADECGLFYKLLPDKTLAFKGEKCVGGNKSKERITVLVCTNMTGSEKLKLLIIGKYKNPRCFKNFRMENLPVSYYANNKAWMTSKVFESFLRRWDLDLRKLRRKILLLVDNCPVHTLTSGLSNIKLVFLPSNVASVPQPMNQGVIRNLKHHYRREILRKQIESLETETKFDISMKDAAFLLVNAWEQVKPETIKNCFYRAFRVGSETTDDNGELLVVEVEPDLLSLVRQVGGDIPQDFTMEDFENIDNDTEFCAIPSDSEIIGQVLANDMSEVEMVKEVLNDTRIPTDTEAKHHLNKVRDWVLANITSERQSETFCSVLGSIELEMSRHRIKCLKQTCGT